MKRLIINLLFLLLAFVSFCQIGTVSKDSKSLATFVYDRGQYQIFIHELATGRLIKKIPVSFTSIKKLSFSPDSKFIIAYSGTILYLYNVDNKRLVKKFYQVKDFSLSRNNVLAVISNSLAYSLAINNMQQVKYNFAYGKSPKNIFISPDGKFIFLTTVDNFIYVFAYANPTRLDVISGSYVYFSKSNFVVKSFERNNVVFKIYAYPTGDTKPNQISEFNTIDVLRSDGQGLAGYSPANILISPSATRLAVMLDFGQDKKLLVYNILDKKRIAQTNNSKYPSAEFKPLSWTDNHTLILSGRGLNGLEYSLTLDKIKPLYWQMLNPKKSYALSATEQQKKRRFSPDYHFVVMGVYEGPRRFLLVRDASLNKRQINYADADFITFSPDSRYLFLLIKGIVFQLNTQDIAQAMINNTVVQLRQLGTAEYANIVEKTKTKDDVPPPGYRYIFTQGIKNVTALDSERLFVIFRGMNLDPKNIEVKLNLVDEDGNIVIGATNPQWLYLWCNLLLQNKSLQVEQSNFIVKEIRENQPTAYALVLDHSGSMGNQRANVLQYGALQLIRKKKPQDAFLLIKYDSRAKLEVPLTKNISPFYAPLGGTGLKGYGAGTALNDAAYLAITQLTKVNYPKKVIFLFTDGYENDSYHTKEQVIKAARRNHVEIFTIGFGKTINTQYLQDIAYLTGGAFYHIYSTDDLRRIFLDVDLKRRYYYKIDFNTRYPGKYIALLQLCQDFHHHDSVLVSFDNNPSVPTEKKHISLNPPLTPQQKSSFKKKLIPKCPPSNPVKEPATLQEFNQIDFPDILFEFDSDKIIKSEEKGLIQIAEFMKKHPEVYLLIEGHTDNVGTHEYNMDLSKRRAEAAKRLLVAKGIAPGRIFTRGYGETRPIAPNDTEEGRAKNRRIEFHIFKY